MMNFAKFFFQGVKNTLRVQNGVNFSYKGPWISVFQDTVIDEWYVGDFMAAEYTIVVDVGNTKKEIIKAMVVAGPEQANVMIYGRNSLNERLVDLSAVVTASKLQLIANPSTSPNDSTYDDSQLLVGSKVIFSATYYYTQNDLTSY